MRKLASIQRILSISPIEGADAIEKAAVLGWQLVIKKGDYKVNDLCVYCEIDSLLPERPEFEFLRERKFRIKTIKLRGVVSQGICFPLSIVPQGDYKEGDDVTEILKIIKYEPPVPAHLQGISKGKIPSFVPKTDEIRIQVIQEFLDKYKGTECYITEKIDGSSVTYYVNDSQFGVCSRNLELLEGSENTLWKIARALDIENKLRGLNKNIALQGEIMGEFVQSNKLKLKGQTVFFFNAIDIDNHCFYEMADFFELLDTLQLQTVPVISKSWMLTNRMDEIMALAKRNSLLQPGAIAEGIVVRPLKELKDPQLDTPWSRFSFKVINPEFLLKYGE